MKILELGLLTDDLFQTERFYTEKLELKIRRKSKSSISFLIGKSILTFVKSDNQNPFYHFAFNIPNNKLDEALSFINSKICVMTVSGNKKIIDFEDWNAKSIYFRDNNGNILEFIARFDINNQINSMFANSQILSISEIGISVDNVTKECELIKLNYNLEYFSKQKPAENFAALGDDNGLLILAKDRRNWFPTDSPSGKHWTKIKFETNGKINEIEFYDKLSSH